MIRNSSGRLVTQGISTLRNVKKATNNLKLENLRLIISDQLNRLDGHRLLSDSVHHRQGPDHNATIEDRCSYYTPKEGYVRNSIYNPITIPEVTLDKYIWQDVHKWQNKIATVCVSTGRQYTFAKLRDCTAAFAIRLQQKLNLRDRDVVAICLPNLPEYLIVVFGTLEAGGCVSPINPVYTADEISRQLVSSNAKLLIGTVGCFETLKQACKLAKRNLPIICIRTNNDDSVPNGGLDFFDLINTNGVVFSDLRPHSLKPSDMAFLPFSSGTTGLPKGVMLTHQNITSNCEMAESNEPFPPLCMETTDTMQEVSPCLLPFFHIYGLTVGMISKIKMGCQLVTIQKFTPDDLLKSLYDYRSTVLNLVPPIVLFLTNSVKVKPKHLQSLRLVLSGAAPIGALDVEKLISKYPHIEFTQGYGLTETSPIVLLGHKGCKNFATVGFPAALTQAKIISYQDGQVMGLGPNLTGELWVRGPQVMVGYLNNQEATDDIFPGDNWMRTGDVGYYDNDGYFYITDRIKELIKVKGFQVAPAELEELLRDHPKVLDAAVIGVPHPEFGEAPRAFIVLRDNSRTTEQEIQQFVADKVTAYKRLEGGVAFIEEVPKTASGKILRRQLKDKYC